MASLKGTTYLYNAQAVDKDDATAYSDVAYVQPGPNTTLYIETSGNATFKIQVAAEQRLNDFDSDDLPDGGLVWYDYDRFDGNAGLTFAVAATQPLAFDLSPFGPSLVRLVCTVGDNIASVTARIASFGPN